MTKVYSRLTITLFGFIIVALSLATSTLAQQKPERPADAPVAASEETREDDVAVKPKRAWTLRMSKEEPHTFSLKAKDASLPEITSEISRLLKIPVFVSPLLEKQRITYEFSGMNLEAAIRMFGPQAYVDYEVGGDEQQPKALAVYLQGLNEKPPSASQVVKGNSEAILIEGDTEEGVGDEETQKKRDAENPLKVSYAARNLSVRARKQPLTVVLYKIANELGIPFEMRYESPEIVDVDFTNYSVEQAIRSLSPAVRLFYRTDLQTYDVQPLRIVLSAPTNGKS
jgi:hypothetical protein